MSHLRKNQLDGIYLFLSEAYKGNWQYRWGGGIPYMNSVNKKGHQESILAHQWSMMALWYQLRRLCPNLDKVVSSEKIYEIILNHDLGETYTGDISVFAQVRDKIRDKHLLERQELAKMAKSLPKSSQKGMLAIFDQYEQEADQIKSPEVLLARFLDALQGDHFAMVFGDKLPKNNPIIKTIVQKRF